MPVPDSARAGRREWIALAVLALPCLVYAMDLTILNLAIPALSVDLHPSSTQALWIVDIYGFMVAGALLTMGSLGDRIGARRLLLIGAAAFSVASLLGVFAVNAEMLIAARALLGLAGATIAPMTLALVRRLFADERQRATAVGLWVAGFSLGAAIGPVVGGAVIDAFGWRAAFVVALPVMALLLIAGPRLLPEHRDPASGRLDILSAAMSLAAILLAVYGLKVLATSGDAVAAVVWAVSGTALGTAFVARQRRLDHPLVDLRLFSSPAFSVALATSMVSFFVIGGMALLVGQLLQSVLGLSALQAGLWMVPEAAAFIVASMATPRLATRTTPAAMLAGAAGLSAVGYLIVAAAGSALIPVIAGVTIGGLGLAAIVTLVTDVAVGAAPAEHAGAAAALSETSSELGGALGLALLGSLGTAVYRAGLPAGASDAVRQTIGGAIAHGGTSATNAAAAFTTSVTVTALISGLLLLATAAAVLAILHRPASPRAVAAVTKQGVLS